MRFALALLVATLLCTVDGARAQEAESEVTLEADLADEAPVLVALPRVAVVIEGGASEMSVEAATRLEGALAASGEVALPDDATRAALLGDRGTAGDGLERIRSLRRRADWTSAGDRDVLSELGSALDVVALVLVRGVEDGSELAARVYDVGAGRFFQGAVVIDAVSTGEGFVLARVRRASERARTAATTPVELEPERSSPLDDQAPERRSWMGRNWPFVVAGVLLAGATTFFVIQRTNADESPPVIHIRPASP